MHEVLLSATFVRQFRKLPAQDQRRVREGLERLRRDPAKPRAGVDIRPLAGTDPPKHRLRVGDLRVVYAIEAREVKVIEVFRRGRGYRE